MYIRCYIKRSDGDGDLLAVIADEEVDPEIAGLAKDMMDEIMLRHGNEIFTVSEADPDHFPQILEAEGMLPKELGGSR